MIAAQKAARLRACREISRYGRRHGYKFKHAKNGGEYYIKQLKYYLDGYDGKNNVAIEFYGKPHKRTIDKDTFRRKKIIWYLKCSFVEIWYNGKINKYDKTERVCKNN